jgi:hypothetical protein
VAVATAAVEWRPESDRWLELPESASGTSARWTSGVGAAVAVVGVPHPAELLAPACDGTSQVIRPTYSCPCPTDLRQPCRCP